ncbi:MAG: efflux RND transporter periplasmic adaptor subunit [Rikenellaceae bacterium]
MNIIRFIAVSALLLSSCNGSEQVKTFERPVRVYQVGLLGGVDKTFSAVVASAETTTLAFQSGGEVVELTIEAGDRVEKGELIAKINPVDFQLKVDAAKAQYITSKADMERYKRLLEKDAVSQQLYESAYANYISRKSSYENALEALSNTQLFSPFSGIVEKKYVDNFWRVQSTEPIVKIINPDTLEINFMVAPLDAIIMQRPKIDYFVRFDTYPNILFAAKLKRFVNVAIGGEGFPTSVSIDDPRFSLKKYDIKAGYSCSVIVRVNTTPDLDYTAIPLSAIYAPVGDKGKRQVWLYDKQSSSVALREIVTGELFGENMIAVKSGLSSGELVVDAGVYQLIEGQKVAVLNGSSNK